MRDSIRVGDQVLFYHSRVEPIGIIGIAVVSRAGYPDPYAFEPSHKYFDPKSKKESPTWYGVDVKFREKFSDTITLAELKQTPGLEKMMVIQKGARLSIQPVSKKEFEIVLKLAKKKEKKSE